MSQYRKLFPLVAGLCTFIIFLKVIERNPDGSVGVSAGQTCQKQTKIAFLKTHKCASSSVQNILMRFGLKNNLNFVLPSVGNYLGRYIKYFKGMLASTPWEQEKMPYDIFCLHTIWNFAEVSATMGPKTTYFTIMRDPVSLFESLWVYTGMETYYHTDLESFAKSPKVGKLAQRAFKNLGRNQMLWDLGLPERQMDNITAAREMITNVENMFDLVMVAEKFDESMVLLKDLLCWDTGDIVNFKLNARKESKITSLSSEARRELEKYLAADYILYNHFTKKFDEKVRQYGKSSMEKGVKELKRQNEEKKKSCSLTAVANEKVIGENRLWGGEKVVAYQSDSSTNPECRLYSLAEMKFIDELRHIQSIKANGENVGEDLE